MFWFDIPRVFDPPPPSPPPPLLPNIYPGDNNIVGVYDCDPEGEEGREWGVVREGGSGRER